jgi:hypothetical protein
MAGGAGVGTYADIFGAAIGGGGDWMQANSYRVPRLDQPGPQESALRRWANQQIRGGTQQLQGATALYNQMAPILLGQLPGMRMVPTGSATESGGGGGAGSSLGTSDSESALGSYQQNLQALQQSQQREERIRSLKRQVQATKVGPARKALKKQLYGLRQEKKASPTLASYERDAMNAAMRPPTPEIRMAQSQPAGPEGSLAAVRGMMDAYRGAPARDLMSLYQGGE